MSNLQFDTMDQNQIYRTILMVVNKLAFISNLKPAKKTRYNIPRLYAKTNFKRSDHPGRPIFILAATFEDKRVNIPDYCEDLTLDELTLLLSDTIIQYHKKWNGKTQFWGDITSYYYQDYKKDFGIEFDTNGNIIEIIGINDGKG